jgi:hypothetical protein
MVQNQLSKFRSLFNKSWRISNKVSRGLNRLIKKPEEWKISNCSLSFHIHMHAGFGFWMKLLLYIMGNLKRAHIERLATTQKWN